MKKLVISHLIVIIITAVLVWFFSNSKTEIHDLKSKIQTAEEKLEKSSKKIAELETKNKKLSEQKKETYIKVVNADGSYTEKKDTQTNTEVYEQTIRDIRSEYEKVLAEKEKTISDLKEYSKVEINKRAFSIGYTKNFLGQDNNHNIISQADVIERFGVLVNTSFGSRHFAAGAGINIKF